MIESEAAEAGRSSSSSSRATGRRRDTRETTNEGPPEEQEDENIPATLFSALACTDPITSRDFIERAKQRLRDRQEEHEGMSTTALVEMALDLLYSDAPDTVHHQDEDPMDIRRAQDLEFERSAAEDAAKDRERFLAAQEAEHRDRRLRDTLAAKSNALSEFRTRERDENGADRTTIMFREPDGERFVYSFGRDATLQTVFDTLDVERGKYPPGSYDLVRNEPPMKRYTESETGDADTTANTSARELDRTAVFVALRC